jgi:hypothetical protein
LFGLLLLNINHTGLLELGRVKLRVGRLLINGGRRRRRNGLLGLGRVKLRGGRLLINGGRRRRRNGLLGYRDLAVTLGSNRLCSRSLESPPALHTELIICLILKTTGRTRVKHDERLTTILAEFEIRGITLSTMLAVHSMSSLI